MTNMEEKSKQDDWHHLFNLILTDIFKNSPFEVESEKDLSLKRQFLDFIVVRRTEGEIKRALLPDGFKFLQNHNLLSYKSIWQPFDLWAANELLGHYVNYRKQVSPSMNRLLPEHDFQLIAVSTRFPKKLSKKTPMVKVAPGVYNIDFLVKKIIIVVLGELDVVEENKSLLVISGTDKLSKEDLYELMTKKSDMSTVFIQTIQKFIHEEGNMSYITLEEFNKNFIRNNIRKLPPKEVFQHFSPKEILQQLPPEEIKKYLRELNKN